MESTCGAACFCALSESITLLVLAGCFERFSVVGEG